MPIQPYRPTSTPAQDILYPKGTWYDRPITREHLTRLRDITADELRDWLKNQRGRNTRPSDKQRFHFATWRLHEIEGILMAGKANKVPPTHGATTFKGFLQRPLSDAEIGDAADRKVKPTDIFSRMNHLVLDGYKLSLSVTKDGAAIASWTDTLESRPSYGYCLSTWGEDPYEALYLSIYKHDQALQGSWASLVGQSAGKKRG